MKSPSQAAVAWHRSTLAAEVQSVTTGAAVSGAALVQPGAHTRTRRKSPFGARHSAPSKQQVSLVLRMHVWYGQVQDCPVRPSFKADSQSVHSTPSSSLVQASLGSASSNDMVMI